MRIVNIDTNSHLAKTMEKCLQESERAKKKIYLESRLQQRRHFSPLVSSVDGLLGVEATDTLKRIASHLVKSGVNPTLGRADTSRVGSPSLWCGPHTGASGVPGCHSIRLASITCSKKTATSSTYSGKRVKRHPGQENPSPRPNPLAIPGQTA